MNTNQIVAAVSKNFHKIGFKLKKSSPEILLVTGIIGAVTSAVMACKATTKLGNILENTKEDVDKVHSVLNGDIKVTEEYTEDDGKKDIVTIYKHTGLTLAKLYAPALIIGGLSIAAILSSNDILKKRNVALAAAYAAIDGSFKDYRKGVVERFGDKIDAELKHGIKAKVIEEVATDENGNEVKTEKTIEVAEIDEHNIYTKIFDESSCYWSKTPEYNQMFLIGRERYANDRLNVKGYLFLNEVLEMLDIPQTKEGQVVGWVKDPKNGGDGYVDFGIFNAHKPKNRDFINGYERSIWLDFNVDGYILDLM